MADNAKYAQLQPFSLAGSGASIAATTITLNSMLQIDGVTTVTMTNFGSKGFATIEPGNGTREEQIVFTGITQNSNGTATLTGVSTVLMVAPYTETSGLAMSHPGGVVLVISNTSGYYDRFTNKEDDETINGDWTFTAEAPTIPTQLSSDIHRAASIEYVNAVAVAGAPNASTTVKGIVQLPTQAQVDAKTTTGSTSALLALTPDKQRSTLLSDYVADTGTANVYVITPSPAATAYTTGQIFTFKALHANTTASTLNVNALGAKTIKKVGGGSDLAANDILLNAIVQVEYDGTNFQMLNPVGNAPATSSQVSALAKFGGTGADGTLDTSGGTVNINLGNAAVVVKNYTSINVATNNLTFTNPNTNGTIIVLKSQGNVAILAGIVASGLGGQTGSNTGYGNVGGARAGTAGGSPTAGLLGQGASLAGTIQGKLIPLIPGSSGGTGGTGGVAGGAGGSGGGALYIECGGALNYTGTITVAGNGGTAGTSSGSVAGGGGGGGGGGGTLAIVYGGILTANSGSTTVTAGTGGAGGTGNSGTAGGSGGGGGGAIGDGANGIVGAGVSASAGGAGGVGVSFIVPNTEFV